MILPVFILIADIAAWWLFQDVWEMEDTFFSIIAFGLAMGFFIWMIIEAVELVQESRNSDNGMPADY